MPMVLYLQHPASFPDWSFGEASIRSRSTGRIRILKRGDVRNLRLDDLVRFWYGFTASEINLRDHFDVLLQQERVIPLSEA